MKLLESKVRQVCGAALYGGFAIFFGWLFYVRFWQWRHCIEEAASSCITPDGANLIQGGEIWSLPAFICAVLCVRRIIKVRRAQQGTPGDGYAAPEF